MEEVLYVQVFHTYVHSRKGYRMPGAATQNKLPNRIFHYQSRAPVKEKVANQLFTWMTMFQSYTTGDGIDPHCHGVQDMCSGIDSIFGKEDRNVVKYSAIHHRYLEGWPGEHILGIVARGIVCDPLATLDKTMTPEYIISISGPLDMLKHPIVLITDYQNMDGLHRLINDTDIDPLIRLIPDVAR